MKDWQYSDYFNNRLALAPSRFEPGQCDPQYNSILDFALVAQFLIVESKIRNFVHNRESYCPKKKEGSQIIDTAAYLQIK